MGAAADLLSALVARGFVVAAVGARLDVSPASALTNEDRAAIRGTASSAPSSHDATHDKGDTGTPQATPA